MGDAVAARLEVARPRRRPLPPRPVGALGVLRARPPARRPRRLRVLAPHHAVVAEVRRVVLEAGAVAAELRRRVGAFGWSCRVGEHDAPALAPLAALAAAAAAGLLPFGCGRIVLIQSRCRKMKRFERHQDVPFRLKFQARSSQLWTRPVSPVAVCCVHLRRAHIRVSEANLMVRK